MDWADAMVQFEDRIQSAIAWANDHGVTDDECAQELRRIADQIDGLVNPTDPDPSA